MKAVILKTIIGITLLSSICVCVIAQQGGTLDDAIRSLIDNITKLEATPISPSMRGTHKQNINEQRIDLIALLGQKKGEMESYANAVSANLRPEQRDRLARQINDLDNQIALQKKTLKGEMLPTDNASPPAAAGNGSTVGDGRADRVTAEKGITATPPTPASPSLPSSTSPDLIVSPPSSIAAATAAPTASSSTNPTCALVLQAPGSFSIREQQICSLVQDVADAKLGKGLPRRVPDATLRLDGAETYIVNIITEAKTVGDVEDTRTDKQTGSDPQAKGTTSLVVKGGTPSILSWAVENGAAVATTSGTTINFRFNPLGIINALGNTGYFASYDESEKDPFTKFLRKTSFGVSFDASRGNQPGVFTGNKQQISAFSARYEFVSDRDPRNKKYAAEWGKLVDENQIDYTNSATKLRAALVDPPHCSDPTANPCPREKLVLAQFKDPVLQKWLDETNAQLRAIKPPEATPESTVIAEVEDVIRKQVGALAIDKIGSSTRTQILSFVESLNSYIKARETLLDKIAKGKVLAFEYTNHREVNAPDTSNFNLIVEKGTVRKMDLSFNASLTMYNKRPAGLNVKRIRDFVFAGQYDAPLREISGVGLPVFSIAGRYERATGNAFALDGTEVPNTKGDVGSLQLKLLLPIKGMGIRLPFSVTFANRSELIREREVRANFGFTFDLDRLFGNNPFFKK